jgi:hypothetical protein
LSERGSIPLHGATSLAGEVRPQPKNAAATFGAIDDKTIAEILAAQPSLRDLSAVVWERGDGDLIAREHRELTAGAQAVIARAGEEWPKDE